MDDIFTGMRCIGRADRMFPLHLIRSASRLVLVAGLVLAALPAAAGAAPSKSCDPFCGVLRFMAPPTHDATAVPARRSPLRITRVALARKPLPPRLD